MKCLSSPQSTSIGSIVRNMREEEREREYSVYLEREGCGCKEEAMQLGKQGENQFSVGIRWAKDYEI